MTVLEDDVIPKRNKLSLAKSCFSGNNSDNENSTRSLKRKTFEEVEVPVKRAPLELAMLNGYRSNDHRSGTDPAPCPVATLANMGNTCFLNCVLYALRFAPTFLHNLHHLIDDLSVVNARLSQNKVKSSSLGRSVGSISGPSSRSTSSKDLLSLGNSNDIPKSKVQIVSEKLHELFMTMHNQEMRDSRDAYQPVAFLQSVREANYIFEGNHQQDAHELLVYLLDNIRETCGILAQQVEQNPELLIENQETPNSTNNSKLWNVRRSWKKTNKKKEKTTTKDAISEDKVDGYIVTDSEDAASTDNSSDNGRKKFGYNFVAEDFEGITLIRTRCLECECVTERKELFHDIPVPILREDESGLTPDEIYKKACVTKEKLCDTNKYLCENCLRYNEASREVSFEKLPNMMVLQLKRFTTTAAGVQKVVSYHPTPLKLACFCDTCCKVESEQLPTHHYELCCIIMHLGGNMASGHYISYVRASDRSDDYTDCSRDIPKTNLSAGSSEKLNLLKYLKPRSLDNKMGLHKSVTNGIQVCKSTECCGVRMNRNLMENVFNNCLKRNGHEWQEDVWLECDDENVKPVSSQEFEEVLLGKSNATSTPYLLFYSKITSSNGMDN